MFPSGNLVVLVISLGFSVYFSCCCDLLCSFFPIWEACGFGDVSMNLYVFLLLVRVALLIFALFFHVPIWEVHIFGNITVILCTYLLLLGSALLIFLHVPIWDISVILCG